MRQFTGRVLRRGLRTAQAVGQEGGGGTGVGCPPVRAEQQGVPAVGTEGGSADEDGEPDGLDGGDGGVCRRETDRQGGRERDGVRAGLVQMCDQVGVGTCAPR